MRLAFLALTAAPLLAAGAAEAATVEFKHAAARVVVIPEDRSDIKVEILKANPKLPLQVRQTSSGKVVVDGGLHNRIRGCAGTGERGRVFLRGEGDVAVADLPQVVVRTPRDVNVDAGGALFGSIGRAESVELNNAGCGDWVVADVRESLILRNAGSGQIRAGRAGEAEIGVAGSGGVVTQAVTRGLDVNVAGSGDVTTAALVDGRLKVKLAGSGNVSVGGGRVSDMDVSIAGSGDVRFDGSAERLDANIIGSGDVYAAAVTGDIDRKVMGSGKVRVGQ